MVTFTPSIQATFHLPGYIPQTEVSSRLLQKQMELSIRVVVIAQCTPLMLQQGRSFGVSKLEPRSLVLSLSQMGCCMLVGAMAISMPSPLEVCSQV